MFDPSLMVQHGPNPGERFAQAFQQGQQARDQNMAKAAMAALVQDPNNAKALAALAKVDPASAMQFRQQQLQYHKAQLAEHQDSILKGAKIIRETNPQDQAGWTQSLALAQQAGVDISQIPQVWNEETKQYAAGIVHLADAFAPQASDNSHFITPQPGGGAFLYDPHSRTTETIIQPNDGSHAVASPAGNVPQVRDQASYDAVPPGQHYTTPDGHVRVKQGGQSPQGSGGFR